MSDLFVHLSISLMKIYIFTFLRRRATWWKVFSGLYKIGDGELDKTLLHALNGVLTLWLDKK